MRPLLLAVPVVSFFGLGDTSGRPLAFFRPNPTERPDAAVPF